MVGGPSASRRHILLLLLLSVAVAAVSLHHGAAAPSPVYDTDGQELSADADYYVFPAAGRRGGGGLTMAPNVFRCPLFVAQEADPLRRGFPYFSDARDCEILPSYLKKCCFGQRHGLQNLTLTS